MIKRFLKWFIIPRFEKWNTCWAAKIPLWTCELWKHTSLKHMLQILQHVRKFTMTDVILLPTGWGSAASAALTQIILSVGLSATGSTAQRPLLKAKEALRLNIHTYQNTVYTCMLSSFASHLYAHIDILAHTRTHTHARACTDTSSAFPAVLSLQPFSCYIWEAEIWLWILAAL